MCRTGIYHPRMVSAHSPDARSAKGGRVIGPKPISLADYAARELHSIDLSGARCGSPLRHSHPPIQELLLEYALAGYAKRSRRDPMLCPSATIHAHSSNSGATNVLTRLTAHSATCYAATSSEKSSPGSIPAASILCFRKSFYCND
jgi:hypothetical protein